MAASIARRTSLFIFPARCVRQYCAQPAFQEYLSATFRTPQNDPAKHTLDHVGQYYTIDPKEMKTIFNFGGFPKSYDKQMISFNENCLMVREPGVELINYLKIANYSHPVNRYMIYGKRGTGKSLALCHALHYAHRAGFLLVHFPVVSDWTKRSRGMVGSTTREGRMDLPVECAVWLQRFLKQNETILNDPELTVSKKYVWGPREETAEGAPLKEVAVHGVNRARHSSDCLAVLLKEVKMLANSGKCRMLVAIDGANNLFYPTYYKIPRTRNKYTPEDFTPLRAFLRILKNDWKNGAIVFTVCDIQSPNYLMESHLPWYLLGKKGFEFFDPFIPIKTENYTEKEINSCIDYYIDRKWIQHEKGRTEEGRKELIFLSGMNPYSLLNISVSW